MIINYYRENERAATHISEFNEVSSRHLVEVGNVVRNYGKLHNVFQGLYENNIVILDSEWEFINEPLSEKFQTIEYTVGVYRLKHTAFQSHFWQLKELSIHLIKEVQNELDLRTKR
jgi:hypothetical protein